MELYEAIKNRRSIRHYEKREVEKAKLDKILDVAHLAPSAKNIQPWKVLVVTDDELKKGLVEGAKGQEFLREAYCIIVVCVNEKDCYQTLGDYMTSFAVDGAIFIDHLTLAAYAEGLGTCWIGKFSEDKVKKLLGIPDPYRVVGMTPLGYPATKGESRGRKPLDEIVYYNKWESN